MNKWVDKYTGIVRFKKILPRGLAPFCPAKCKLVKREPSFRIELRKEDFSYIG